MNDNPEGTPNPLNSAPGAVSPASFAEPAATGPAPISETKPTQITITEPEPAAEPAPTAEPEMANPVPVTKPIATRPATATGPDPMMRPRGNNNFGASGVKEDPDGKIPFDEITEEIVASSVITPAPDNFVVKDSVVGSKGSKKKPLIIGAIALIMIAIICAAAAIAILVVNNTGTGDRVTKAIEKLINGETPNIINAKGTISSIPSADFGTAYSIDLDGTFNLATSESEVSAEVSAAIGDDIHAVITVDEIRDEEGDTFFKIAGLNSLVTPTLKTNDCIGGEEGTDGCAPVTLETENVTNCIGGGTETNCITDVEEISTSTTTGLFSLYGKLFDTINDQWILVSGDLQESLEGLNIFNNSSACLLNATKTLPEYSKNIASSYKNNQFITYSTNNLEISKKKDTLYRLGYDADKLASFINSLSNSGFMNELNACMGNSATNINVSADAIKEIFANFPAVYVEIDDNDNFTRVYFESDMTIMDGNVADVTADFSISYPGKLQIETPDSYIGISTIMNNALVNLLEQ